LTLSGDDLIIVARAAIDRRLARTKDPTAEARRRMLHRRREREAFAKGGGAVPASLDAWAMIASIGPRPG
jgi:hypothetical protein